MHRVAIIGCGNIAGGYDDPADDSRCQTHAQACRRRSDLSLVAVCDRDAEKARSFATRWAVPAFHADAREMLAMHRPDIVVVASTTGTHQEMLELCLTLPWVRAVVCEKPVGYDPRALAALVPRFDAAGMLLVANYTRACAAGIQQFRCRLEELGGCLEASVEYGKGVFNYGSHAIQWLADWLGVISGVTVERVRPGAVEGDPLVDAEFFAGATPARFRGATGDRFDVAFECARGALRFTNYACEVNDAGRMSRTGLETAMDDVYRNLTARLRGESSRLVEGREASRVIEICTALADTSHS